MKAPEQYILLALVALLALCLPSRSSAAIHFSPDNWPDSNWSLRNYGTSFVGIDSLQGHNWLRIGRSGTSTGSAQLIYTGGSATEAGTPVPVSENQLGDFQGSVILGSSKWGDSLGVVLRAQGHAFNNNASSKNAYYLALSQNGLGLYWGVGEEFLSAESVVRLAYDPYSQALGVLTATTNKQYLLDFSAIGFLFEATLWALDENGEKVGDALASISYLDERPEARADGYFGLRGGRYGGERNAYFRDLKIEAIPEPSMAAFLLLGLGMGVAAKLIRGRAR